MKERKRLVEKVEWGVSEAETQNRREMPITEKIPGVEKELMMMMCQCTEDLSVAAAKVWSHTHTHALTHTHTHLWCLLKEYIKQWSHLTGSRRSEDCAVSTHTHTQNETDVLSFAAFFKTLLLHKWTLKLGGVHILFLPRPRRKKTFRTQKTLNRKNIRLCVHRRNLKMRSVPKLLDYWRGYEKKMTSNLFYTCCCI